MAHLLLTLLLTAAGAASTATDCTSASDSRTSASSGRCFDRDTASASPPITDSSTARGGAAHDADRSTPPSSDDDPWTFETGSDDLEHVCITRGAGGVCLESDN